MRRGYEQPTVTVDIDQAGSYGSSVGFYVAEAARDSRELMQLVDLWSATLAQVEAHYADHLAHPPAVLWREMQAIAEAEAGYSQRPAA